MRTLAATLLLAATGSLAPLPAHAEPGVTIATEQRADLPISVPTEAQNYDAYPRDLGFSLTGPPGAVVTIPAARGSGSTATTAWRDGPSRCSTASSRASRPT